MTMPPIAHGRKHPLRTQVKHMPNIRSTRTQDLPPISAEGDLGFEIAANDDDFQILLGKFVVPAELVAQVDRKVREIRPYLVKEAEFGPEELVGEAYWEGLSALKQRLVLLCLQHLAAEPDYPLHAVEGDRPGRVRFATY